MPPGPSTIIHSGYTLACFGPDGSIEEGRQGLYDFDTRLLSLARLTVGARRPELVTSAQPESDRWEAVLRIPRADDGSAAGPLLPQDVLGVVIRRRVGPGMIEAIEIRNHSAEPCPTTLALALEADFADVGEVARERRQRGETARVWDAAESALVIRYSAEHEGCRLERAVRIRVLDATSEPGPASEGLAFQVDLGPGATWTAELRYESLVDGRWRYPDPDDDRRSRQRAAWRARRPRLDCGEPFRSTFERAVDDLFDLRNWELEERLLGQTDGSNWILNAGVPVFTGFFGRDALTSAWQAALAGSRAARGALAVANATQAAEHDPWRDAEPGKMIHEMRRGPVADLGIDPRDAYFGTQTTPAMFVLALSELWHWTGDTDILRSHRDAALRGLEWAERHGDADGDGFLEYQRRSPEGLRNQGWKDSDEAIRYPDGRLVEGPIATVEEQAFHFIALQRMAEILVALGEADLAETFVRRARMLRRRWHEAFWMPEERFYALALDGEKRQVRSITSNPGHALATGIVPPAHAREVADRLMSPELFSGWGIRTLSSRHPSYNPFAYHLGAVWPVEQATFALGFKRYGLDDHTDRLIGAMCEAAAACPDHRLPEALSGLDRTTLSRPVLYPEANSPQAWSASALVQLVQIMFGIYPFAPLGIVALVRPRLPVWLPEVTLRGLRVGRATLDIRFTRRRDGSARHRVERRRGQVAVLRAGPPQVDTAGLGPVERAKRAALAHLPGRLARSGRLALGLE